MGLDSTVGIRNKNGRLFLQFGGTPPYYRSGFQQINAYFALGQIFEPDDSVFRFYAGPALGVHLDILNGQTAYTPSIVFTGGMRFGGKNLGIQIGMTSFFGINPFWQFISSRVAWPMTNFTGGLYVAL